MKPLFFILGLIPLISLSAEEKLNFDDHILPIFEKSCTSCHNLDKKKGDLDLSTYGGFIAGSSGGKIASAGDGSGSKIFTTATHSQEPFMPPKGKGEKLDKKDLLQVRQWIDEGLLETKDSKAKKDNTPKIDFSKFNTQTKKGPAPVPLNLSLEPVTTPKKIGVISDIECSPTAPVLAITSQQQTLLFHTNTLELIGVIPFPKSKKGVMNPESLSFHPGGKFLLVGGGVAGKLGLTACWDVMTGETLMTVAKEYDSVIATSLRKDLKGIATGGPSKRVKLWDVAANTLEFNHKKHTDWVTSLSYSHDGVLLASGGRGGGVWIWEAHSGNEFHKLSGHKSRIVCSKWSPDSNYLATASEDGSLRIWNVRDGKQVKKIDAHKGGVLDMDWSNKGEFVTVGRDGFIKIWKPNYTMKKQFHHKSSLPLRAEWSHDAGRVFVADYEGRITVWDANLKQIGTVDGNPKPVGARIKAYENEIVKLQPQLAKVNATVASAEKSIRDLKNQIKSSQQQLNNKKVYQVLQKNQKTNEAKLSKVQQEIPKLQDQIKKEDAEIKSLTKQGTDNSEQLKLLQASNQRLSDRLAGVQAQIKLFQINTKKFKMEANELKGKDKFLRDQISHLEKELQKVKGNGDKKKGALALLKKLINTHKKKSQDLKDHLNKKRANVLVK